MNRLVEVLAKAKYALDAVDQAQALVHHPGGLWYHAIGLYNAYYALLEELRNRTKNGNDVQLKEAVDFWLSANRSSSNSLFQNDRNTITHQGAIEVSYYTTFEDDILNDKSPPVRSAMVSIKGSQEIRDIIGAQFIERCRVAIQSIYDGILAINTDYKARGGTFNALPEEKDMNDIFKDFDRL